MDELEPKNTSKKQIEANRRNAQKSTGPKTARGRAISKMNAIKHGLLGRQLLVGGKQARESRHELGLLQKRFWDYYEPVGPAEEGLVDQIITAQWRLRRALKAESGEIAMNVDSGHWRRSRKSVMLESMDWEAFGDPKNAMQSSVMGNHFLIGALTMVRASVEKTGELTEAAINKVILHGKPYYLTRDLENLRIQLEANLEGLDPEALRAKKKKEALIFIGEQLSYAGLDLAACLEHEKNKEEALQAAAVLPSLEVLDKIMRYETKLERQMYRAMNQLERFQRRRRGEAVPPPLAMDVSDKL